MATAVAELFGRIGFKFDDAGLKQFDKGMDRARKGFDGLSRQASRLAATATKAFVGVGGAIGGLAFAAGKTSADFERLRARLEAVTGSASNAADAFSFVKDFAKETPFQVSQVTDAFIKLTALGLDPGRKSLKAYGDFASASGIDIMQMIEAVADASTFEFERLKELGIIARQEGDKVKFTFRNQTHEIQKDAKSIEKFLVELSETNFGGAMDKEMLTLHGTISNIRDNIDAFMVEIGEGGLLDALKEVGDEIKTMTGDGSSLAKTLGQFLATAVRKVWRFISDLIDRFQALKQSDIDSFFDKLTDALDLMIEALKFVIDNWKTLATLWVGKELVTGLMNVTSLVGGLSGAMRSLGGATAGASSGLAGFLTAARALSAAGIIAGIGLTGGSEGHGVVTKENQRRGKIIEGAVKRIGTGSLTELVKSGQLTDEELKAVMDKDRRIFGRGEAGEAAAAQLLERGENVSADLDRRLAAARQEAASRASVAAQERDKWIQEQADLAFAPAPKEEKKGKRGGRSGRGRRGGGRRSSGGRAPSPKDSRLDKIGGLSELKSKAQELFGVGVGQDAIAGDKITAPAGPEGKAAKMAAALKGMQAETINVMNVEIPIQSFVQHINGGDSMQVANMSRKAMIGTFKNEIKKALNNLSPSEAR